MQGVRPQDWLAGVWEGPGTRGVMLGLWNLESRNFELNIWILNQNPTYFKPIVSGPGKFDWWRNVRSKNLWVCSFKIWDNTNLRRWKKYRFAMFSWTVFTWTVLTWTVFIILSACSQLHGPLFLWQLLSPLCQSYSGTQIAPANRIIYKKKFK